MSERVGVSNASGADPSARWAEPARLERNPLSASVLSGFTGATRHGGPLLTIRQIWAAIAAALAAAALAACGSNDQGPATASPSAAAGSAIDQCLVGTWKSTGISGTITVGGAKVSVAGGAGEVLTISASGSIRTDEAGVAPVTGVGADGSQYSLVQSGTAVGRLNASAGRMAVVLEQPTTLTVTLSKNGHQVASQHPGSANDTYTCSSGSALTVTGGGGTVSQYVPA